MLGPQIDEENIIVEEVSLFEALTHFASIGWKYVFAIVPPPRYMNGYPCFVCALAMIGVVTAIVGEMASLLGCAIGIPESVTAITLVALGTSLPDTFASMVAAKNSESADSAIGNITGSNSVNVFLGLGLPWAIAATYWTSNDLPKDSEIKGYQVPSGDLAFSVFVFLVVAILCFIVLIIRRICVGGELGGSNPGKLGSAILLMILWVVYIVMSIMQSSGAFSDE
jgi:solute carrier family 8 (sodium/calcium exchanger)